jgi:hypothetical protein
MKKPAVKRRMLAVTLIMPWLLGPLLHADIAKDADYTAKILEFTTEKFFLTEMVDHLPASADVPSPLKVLGHIVGAPDILDYSKDILRYFRALDAASPRVEVFSLGRTDEGKEMIAAAVSSDANMKDLGRIREAMARLADPRQTPEKEAEPLITGTVPVYWVTGGLHSLESGSPEMLMELAYRLAVSEEDWVRNLRANLVVLITPILEVDGWDRAADVYRYKKDNKDAKPIWAPYWGNYVWHDNNRDFIGLSLKLSRNVQRAFFDWHPIVMHDLHESIPYLYVSTGTGPFNAWLDPIIITEWEELAAVEVNELTRRGVPGVWTHGFWDGWSPSYIEYAALFHNAIGRFYETFGGTGADTQVRTTVAQAKRDWYRPNPPLEAVKWSFRNNINLQQSGVLVALKHVAANRQRYLRQFYVKGLRAVAKARNEGPAAYVIPADNRRPLAAARLARLLQRQGVEIHRADKEIVLGKDKFPAGSLVVRLDQPYSRCADMLLDVQYYNPNDPKPYDDSGWTLGPLFNVKTIRVTDVKVLDAAMTKLEGDPAPRGELAGRKGAAAFLVAHRGEAELAALRFRLGGVRIRAAEKGFMAGEGRYLAGSFIIERKGNPSDLETRMERALAPLGLTATGVSKTPDVPTHDVALPRLALVHSWFYTQEDGWFRLAFEDLGIPYSYISLQDLRDTADLRAKYDVIILPPMMFLGTPQRLVNGIAAVVPIPWQKSERYPNLGGPVSRADIRGGIELQGILGLKRFLDNGGLLVSVGSSSGLVIDYGLAEGVIKRKAKKFRVAGTILNASVSDPFSPILYGYERERPLAVYFNSLSLLETGVASILGDSNEDQTEPGAVLGKPSGRGGLKDPDVAQGRPKGDTSKEGGAGFDYQTRELLPLITPRQFDQMRAVLRFESSEKALVSGLLDGAEELATKPAVIDVPAGKGHVVLFAINPMYRQQTWGSYALLLNAALHFDHLDAGRPAAPAKK